MRILLADDHTLVRQGLMPFFKALDPDVEVVEASTLDEALEAAQGAGVLDLILLDLKMPGMRGTQGLVAMVKAYPSVPVVILSGSVEAADVMSCADGGAAGYLPKTLNSTAMINALRLVLSGERYFPSFAFSAPRKPSEDAEPDTSNPLSQLEEREKLILGMVVEGRTNKEIARALDLQEVTIKVQTRNIYRKLGAANRSQAVRIAMENGWRLTPGA
ncbi:response regulator [Insolitispirillum peregrinum]|uniref:Two component transcriptional regulator, LuxR family n=1 Tax=Insolitispirillum peregrinum TaxID=80876 RepID=A0A1N7MVQ1_9PROT|nr:response regulator transcription factor [Insolitispirillum peregrinum]SIS90203.1 two component transcriptional regulator, LuxR family [Insolitispirillum peregrinum]